MDSEDFQKTIIEAVRDFRQEVKLELGRINDNVKRLEHQQADTTKELRGLQNEVTGIMYLLRAHEDYKDTVNLKVDRIEEKLKRLEDRIGDNG